MCGLALPGKTEMQAQANIQLILSQDPSVRQAGLHINSLKLHDLVQKGLILSFWISSTPKHKMQMQTCRFSSFWIICHAPKITQVTALNSPIKIYPILLSLPRPRPQNKQFFTFQEWLQLETLDHKRALDLSFSVGYCPL